MSRSFMVGGLCWGVCFSDRGGKTSLRLGRAALKFCRPHEGPES